MIAPFRVLPGIALCVGIGLAARALQAGEEAASGYPYVEALVLAILLGTALRTVWEPPALYAPGIEFCAKLLLEIAVMLLGATVSVATLAAIGPALLTGIAIVVMLALVGSFAIGRVLGLSRKMAILVACGNSICGNSAIAAVAPVIGADAKDVAAAIAFTAVLGVIVVLGLPLLSPVLMLSQTQYGVLAGLTVYAVPQVLAATLPIGALSNQVGTLVKLVRVLMLGPVVLALSLGARRSQGAQGARAKFTVKEAVPWFIAAFLVLAALRSVGIIPASAAGPFSVFTAALTTVSMAGLGLGVDVAVVARAGGRVTAAVTLSLVVLGVVSLALIRLIGVV